MKTTLVFLLALSASSFSPAQAGNPAGYPRQAAFTYTWARSNAPVGGCGCFSLNGGSGQFAYRIGNSNFAGAIDVSATTQSNVDSTGNQLTLTVFTGGIRWYPFHRAWMPYAQALIGAGHASGPFAQTSIGPGNSKWSFAGNFGGGIDRSLSSHWSLHLIEADYLLDRFNNHSNNHQNLIRLSSGVGVRF
jgi:outer membrane immunogenic protein